jgi:hypothetical protein
VALAVLAAAKRRRILVKKTIMAVALNAGLILAPISSAIANTVAAQPDDAIASAWVPATLAEQQAARGGYSYSGLSPLFSALNTICSNFNIYIRFNNYNRSKGNSCGNEAP